MIKDQIYIEIKETEERNKEILKKYWEIDDHGNFLNRPTDIKEQYGISIPEIRKLVKEYSYVTFDKGQCECGNPILIEVSSQQQLNEEVRDYKKYDYAYPLKCEKCLKEEELKAQQLREKEKQIEREHFNEKFEEAQKKLEIAFKEERWRLLDDDEFDVLLVMARSKSKGQVFHTLFNGKDFHSPEGKEVWKMINKLDSLGLIWINRDIKGSINDFYMIDSLRQSLLEYIDEPYEPGLDPNYFVSSKEDTFRFFLRPNGHKIKTKHPNYSGKFTLTKNILLEENKEYRYGGWINDDGTIYIKITPADEPFLDAKERYDEEKNSSDMEMDSKNVDWDSFPDSDAPPF
ncbi:MAG: hypothetical protein ACOCWW_00370 [Bacteroidota bacterium]